MPQAVYFVGVLISLTILAVAYLNFRRKSGVFVRGSYSMASSIYCDDRYVSEVVLENQKDRVVTLFGIYLQVGHAYHIQIEDFEEAPFALKPYQAFHKEYGPIEHYEVSLYKVDFNDLLNDRKIRKRLVLSTSEGRYIVRKRLKRWYPIGDYFRNHLSAMARPIQSKYKDKHLGSRVKYVIEFIGPDGREEIVPIHPSDWNTRKFRSFSLTKESLESRDSLHKYLSALHADGVITCARIEVHDVDEWRARWEEETLPRKAAKAENYGAIYFHVIGPVYTRISNWKLRRSNRRSRTNVNHS